MARSAPAAGMLHQVTGGVVDLFRSAGRPPFDERDLRHVAALAPGIAQSLAGLAVPGGQGKRGEGAEAPVAAQRDPGPAVVRLRGDSGELVARLFGEHALPLMHAPDAELVHVYDN
ncbi:hypothetical protein [Nonomuraea sp. JJY05]|uniref:hypothetical protein n=1 Tax=Nonomuraea sp. JJY05 TaxID=3350255 RepID=UPI00373F8307